MKICWITVIQLCLENNLNKCEQVIINMILKYVLCKHSDYLFSLYVKGCREKECSDGSCVNEYSRCRE